MPSPTRRRLAAAAVGVLLVTGCTNGAPDAEVTRDRPRSTSVSTSSSGPARSGSTTTAGGSTTSAPEQPDIGPARPEEHASLGDWSPCRGAFECATLTVPRDWGDTAGATIELAVIRQATDGEPIGSLILNPGGPGASGLEFLDGFASGALPDGLDERFDLVSWDPRGTGESERVDCTTDDEWLEADLDPTPEDQADIDAIRVRAQESVTACEREEGDLLSLVGTRATARDLDALRGVLGDADLSYVGYSYGTTIGLEYLRLYPDRVRAMVLDGVSVPGVDPVTDTFLQGQGFERTLDAYLANCPERPSCTLGEEPKAALLDLVAELETRSIPASYSLEVPGAVQRDGALGVGELYIAIAASLYSEQSWPVLDRGLDEATGEQRRGITLLALRDDYLGRQPDGSWLDDADSRSTIRCADQAERAEQPEGDLALAEEWAADLPFWGAWFASGTPGCWGAPEALEPLAPLADGDISGAPPVVVIGTTNDPATPYSQATDARRIIEGSVLVTYEGEEHTAYRSISDCVDDAVTAYLVEATPPVDGLRCTD